MHLKNLVIRYIYSIKMKKFKNNYFFQKQFQNFELKKSIFSKKLQFSSFY